LNTCKDSDFVVFFNNHANALRNFLIYRFGNVTLAEDFTQEAFIKLWQNCKDVPIEKAKSYIYTVARNSFLNEIKHQKVVLQYEKSTLTEDTVSENPENILENNLFEEKLNQAINNLNETQRVAFLMHRIDGKKYKEIAEELDISIKAVEKRIHLAMVALKDALQKN
jgi:RNA polymerase sigma-70 factor (family 1)